MLSINICGDVYPTATDIPYFISGDADRVFGSIYPQLKAADINLINLETPFIMKSSPIPKSGANFGVPGECINAIKNANIKLLNLGNNHIMDHGPDGLLNTISVIKDANLDYVGVGNNLQDAQKPYVFEAHNQSIGIFSFAETEFSIAGTNKPGANPLDLINFMRSFAKYKTNLDHTIILLHAGKEHYPFPTPELQKLCRFMIEEGANIIVCQHSHCIGAIESYLNGIVFYGQGNFIFNPGNKNNNSLYQGFMLTLLLEKSRSGIKYSITPFKQQKLQPGLCELTPTEYDNLQTLFRSYAEVVGDVQKVHEQWKVFSKKKTNLYFSVLRGHNAVVRKINSFIPFSRFFYSRSELLTLLNIIRCQSHKEVLTAILEDESNIV